MGRVRGVCVAAVLACCVCSPGVAAARAPRAVAARLVWSRPHEVLAQNRAALYDVPGLISCPGSGFCAIGAAKSVWTSAHPEALGLWTRRRVSNAAGGDLQQLVCTGTHFCFGLALTSLVWSASATGGTGAWSHRVLPYVPFDAEASCVGTRQCAYVDGNGFALTRDPAAPSPTWTTVRAPFEPVLCNPEIRASRGCPSTMTGLGCASVTLCVATDGRGQLLTTANFGAHARWRARQVGPVNPADEASSGVISCPTRSFCAAVTGTSLVTSADPGGPIANWHVSTLPDSLEGTTCASAHLCLGYDDVEGRGLGHVLFSTNPASAHPTWTSEALDGTAANAASALGFSFACPTATECLLLDPEGRVLTGHLVAPGS